MKKLLVLSVAMAGATTLLAAEAPVAGFESYETGDMSITTAEDGYYFWDTTNLGQQTGSIVEYSGDGVTAPEAISLGNKKYFHVDSGSDTVLRNSVSNEKKSDDQGYEPTVYEDLGKYMDAYVQFTAADEPESLTGNADKIRFYLLKTTDEQENETLTFHVCAGYLADSENSVTATDYEVTFGDNFTPAENTWYRLVIKTIDNISTGTDKIPGFVIYLDGKPATSTASKGAAASAMGSLSQTAGYYNETGNLFPSMIAYNADKGQKLVGLGFRGTGNVDNIAFTTAAPADYAADPTLATPIELYIGDSATPVECTDFNDALTKIGSAEAATVKLNKSFDISNVTFEGYNLSIVIDLNGNTLTTTEFYDAAVTFVNSSTTVDATISGELTLNSGSLTFGADGYAGTLIVEAPVSVLDGEVAVKGGKFANAIDGAYTTPDGYKDALELVDGYYVLVAEGGSVTPTVDPVTGSAEFDTVEEANAATVAVPAAVASTGVTAEEYDGYFTKTTTPPAEEGGKYTVTATLNKAVVLPQDVGEDEAETEMLEGLVSIAIGEAEGVSITTKKGLYYWVDGATELGAGYTAGTAVLGDGTAQDLSKPTLDGEDGKAFYKVSVGVEAPAAE